MSTTDVLENRARWVVEHGRAEDVLRTLPDGCVDAMVTDPPAGIGFMRKGWDHSRGGRGPWVEWLAAILSDARRVLRPGAWALVWALPRTSHWTACAIEDAGFDVRDVVVHLTGVGWPKNRGTLKPASEHWILARVPGPIVPLEIDATRICTDGLPRRMNGNPFLRGGNYSNGHTSVSPKAHERRETTLGRWPANVTLEHSPRCVEVGARWVDGTTEWGWQCKPDCPIRALDESTGVLSSGDLRAGSARKVGNVNSYGKATGAATDVDIVGDEGGPSRFFYCARARSTEQRGEDNTHPTVKPIDLMRWLVRLVAKPGALVLDPFTGSGSTGVACSMEQVRFIGIENDPAYVEIARKRIGGDAPLFDVFANRG